MKLLRVQIQGWTATFRLPLLYTGTSLSAPVPPYSTLLGLIGSVAGREIRPDETRIGYEFNSEGVALDLERTQRLKMTRTVKARRLSPQPQSGVAKRQFHIYPQLDLYLDNVEFRTVFESPKNTPCLGRSQDVAWVTSVDVLDAESVPAGVVRGTLIPYPQPEAGGLILRLPDFFENADTGYTRRIGKLGMYQVSKHDAPTRIRREGLVRVEGSPDDNVIYLHTLGLQQEDISD